MTSTVCCSSHDDDNDACCENTATVATVVDDDPALAKMMADMELEAENIVENDEALQSDLQNRSLKMLTPSQVEELKKDAERKMQTPQQKRAALRKMIQAKKADRTKLTADQRPTDAKGRVLRGRARVTKQQMQKAQTGQLGQGAGNVDINNITPEQMAQATDMLEKNPQLKV